MNKMIWLCGVGLIGGCVDMKEGELAGSTEQAVGPDVVVHTSANGGMAGASYWDQETWTQWNVLGYEYGTGPARFTHLSFGFSGPDPATLGCDPTWDPMWGPPPCATMISVWGMGEIPSGDFVVSPNGTSAQLHTTTDSTFWVQSCRGWWDCSLGGAYSFDLTFTGNNFMRTEQTGTRFFTMGTPDMNGQILGIRTSGPFTSQGAYVEGTAFGSTISNAFGQIMHTNGVTVAQDLVRTHN